MSSTQSEYSSSKNSNAAQLNIDKEEAASQPNVDEAEAVPQPNANEEEAAPIGPISYIPLEEIEDLEAKFTLEDKERIQYECDTPSSVQFYFKNPVT